MMILSLCSECGAAVREHAATCLRCGRPLTKPSARKGVVAPAIFAHTARVLIYFAFVVIGFSALVVTASAVFGLRPH